MHITVADDRPAIAEAFRDACELADLVIMTGGLGPTDDDLTRFALADVMGVDLQRDESSLAEIAAFFQRRGRQMVERNKVQAMCPVGATMLSNPAGTAPAMTVTFDGTRLFCLPGVPREMVALWDKHIVPALPAGDGHAILTAKINTFGLGESDIAEKLADLMARDRNPTVGTTVSGGVVSARIRSTAADRTTADQQLQATIAEVESRLGDLVFSRDDVTLAEALGDLLREQGRSIVTAESCTGGLVGKLLTDAPGASHFYRGGWVTYDNAMKTAQLGVPADLFDHHGAVSRPVAEAMAEGARRAADADLAVSITGVAGPAGGTDHKPVGTVWFALAGRDQPTAAQRHVFPGDRDLIRLRAALHAINITRLHAHQSP
jgi:nicotinamide-nucleotide amidase